MALKEYREKRPSSVTGFRVKKAVILQRGYGPSIIVSGLKGQVPPYLLLADYGDHYRLYYLLENGITLNAINIPKAEFIREELKFQKATSQLFQIPKATVPESKLEKLKTQINAKFQNYLSSIEKQTSCAPKHVPIITIYQDPLETKAIIKRERDLLKFPLELITHQLLDGFIAREAYRLALPSFIKKTTQRKLLELIGPYYLIAKTLQTDWLRFWDKKFQLKAKVTQLPESFFHTYLQFLNYLAAYESSYLSDPQLDKILATFSRLSQEIGSNPRLAAYCYLDLDDHDPVSKIKASLFFILATQLKDATDALKQIPKKSQQPGIQQLKTYCKDLVTYHLSRVYATELESTVNSLRIEKLMNEAVALIKSSVLLVERIHAKSYPLDEPITITLRVKNLSDLVLKEIATTDNLPSKAQLQLITSNKFYFTQIRPQQTLTCEYEITGSAPQKVWFKNGRLTFEDTYGNHYVQTIPPTHLQMK
jgi:hypothetical protein